MADFDGTLGPEAPKPNEPGYRLLMWRGELERARVAFEKWEEDAKKIEDRYALEGDRERAGTKINLLWSNVETLGPALYAKPPKMIATRRFLDKDPIGRVACRIIQRAVQYQVDGGEIHQATQMVVLDRLLAGRGQVWCRYEPTFEEDAHDAAGAVDPAGDDGDPEAGDGGLSAAGDDDEPDAPPDATRIKAEVVHVDYVHWRDFRHDPARTWDEVWWVSRRVYMMRSELTERFGDKGKLVPLVCGPDGGKKDARPGAIEAFRKAEVWEIWDKQRREVVWIATGYDDTLDVRPDPYGLESFFPCPKPLFATLTNGSLVPTSDYQQYRTQAEQLDRIADRENDLTEAMRVRGAYDASAPELGRILKSDEGSMVAVDDMMSKFAQGGGGGLSKAVDFLPLDIFAKGLEALAKRKAEIKADAFEVTGMSDILRGQGDAGETATGVQTKGHFATLRLKKHQKDVAEFVRDVVRIMTEMTCELFQPETLAEMASAYEMDELQVPAPPPMPLGLPMPMSNCAPLAPQRLPMMAGPGAAPGVGS